MKFYIFLFLFFFITILLNSQVGIGTKSPNATLEVIGNPSNSLIMDGFIPPKLTGNQLQSKTYSSLQNGAIVFVTQGASAPSGQTSNVISSGLYVFNASQNKWVGLVANNTAINNVFCNNNNPNVATIFDINNPVVSNNSSLIQNVQYSYIGLDGSIWIWNGINYISYNQNISLNIGQRNSIFRTMNNSVANGTIIDTSGLIELDGLIRIDIKKIDNFYYSPRILNISESSIDITYQSFSTIYLQNEQIVKGTLTSKSAFEVDADNLVAWSSSLNEVETCNIVLSNGKWYEIQWYAYEVNSVKYIFMTALRKF